MIIVHCNSLGPTVLLTIKKLYSTRMTKVSLTECTLSVMLTAFEFFFYIQNRRAIPISGRLLALVHRLSPNISLWSRAEERWHYVKSPFHIRKNAFEPWQESPGRFLLKKYEVHKFLIIEYNTSVLIILDIPQ